MSDAKILRLRIHRTPDQEAARDELVRAALVMAKKFLDYRNLGHQKMAVGAKEATALIAAAEGLLS